tara:strand:- start:162 stop:1253 length:1092 start_codon:yes stop_codon:yes gene_type:complete
MTEMLDIDSAWNSFCEGDYNVNSVNTIINNKDEAPKCSQLYISTKTKISYLSQKIDLEHVFWKIPITPYQTPQNGIIKKQMKFNSSSQDQLDYINSKLAEYIPESIDQYKPFIDEHIITRIVNPEGRIKFKDVRKISIGLCKKDITSYRCKKKSAFYNCFVVILRIYHEETFKEIHVKVFNTGKLEIPGIQSNDILDKTLILLTDLLKPYIKSVIPLTYLKDKSETVLINSNFNCGYFINREKLFDILKYKYKVNCAFDPCSYPGIQSEFYYDKTTKIQSGRQPSEILSTNNVKVSFMIFRTGSVLIVGKCPDDILNEIYIFIKNLLETEYTNIKDITSTIPITSKNTLVKRKMRKKIILTTN